MVSSCTQDGKQLRSANLGRIQFHLLELLLDIRNIAFEHVKLARWEADPFASTHLLIFS
jgi:hypothetical protein